MRRTVILVVDDDADVRDMLCDVLASEGYAVASARNGMEALAAARANPTGICMIMLDVMMPVMSGVEFRERQRADPELSHIPVAIMSARWETRGAFEDVEFLRKPMRLDDMLAVVRQHCGPLTGPCRSTQPQPRTPS